MKNDNKITGAEERRGRGEVGEGEGERGGEREGERGEERERGRDEKEKPIMRQLLLCQHSTLLAAHRRTFFL